MCVCVCVHACMCVCVHVCVCVCVGGQGDRQEATKYIKSQVFTVVLNDVVEKSAESSRDVSSRVLLRAQAEPYGHWGGRRLISSVRQVIQLHICIFFFRLSYILVYHRISNVGPCACLPLYIPNRNYLPILLLSICPCIL